MLKANLQKSNFLNIVERLRTAFPATKQSLQDLWSAISKHSLFNKMLNISKRPNLAATRQIVISPEAQELLKKAQALRNHEMTAQTERDKILLRLTDPAAAQSKTTNKTIWNSQLHMDSVSWPKDRIQPKKPIAIARQNGQLLLQTILPNSLVQSTSCTTTIPMQNNEKATTTSPTVTSQAAYSNLTSTGKFK